MRKTLLFLLLLCSKLTFGQLHDDFSDGNLTENPTWQGQVSQFYITADKKLRSSLSVTAQTVSIFSANNLALNAKWEFSVQLNFDPSTTNLTRIYLIADKEDLSSSLNGYFIQIGESGSADSYDLYRQTGNLISKIIDCPTKNRADINYLSTKLRITRDDFGKWELFSAAPNSAIYNLEGSVIDNTFTNTNYFGVYARYTATRSDGFIFDDFKIEELVADLTPPRLLGIKVVDDYELEVTFSEKLAVSSSLVAQNYRLKEQGTNPLSVSATNESNIVRLHFTNAFETGQYSLVVHNLKDLKGNELIENNEISTFFVKPYVALKGDVIINEIFADPSPVVGLPPAEFVEIWNTTPHYIKLAGWKYRDLTTTATFLADTLKPNERIILCSAADTNLFKVYGRVIGLSTWPSLNNDKDKLSLLNAQNILIDEVFYNENLYKDVIKSKGGYSLELIDPRNNCVGTQNWQASIAALGGTPGTENSVYRKQLSITIPKILKATVINGTTISLDFNKSIDSLRGSLVTNYSLNNGTGVPESAKPQWPDFSTVILKWAIPIDKGREHTLSVDQITDCAGNLIDQTSNTLKIFLAKEVLANELMISEILVNPKAGGVDFIEVYNNAAEVKDLATVKLGTIDGNGNPSNIKTISTTPVLIPPKAYWVLTTDPEVISQHYELKNPVNITKMNAMPTYTNEEGTVILLGALGVIDRFDYREDMHFSMLQIAKGVSLERVSFHKSANEKGNFKSASQASGFATPSYRNSQEESSGISNKIWFSSKVFSPDGDGFDDALQINFELIDHDFLANVTIYNDKGVMIKKLARNSNIAKAGSFIWDGSNDGGATSKIGIYLVKFEIFALNGRAYNFEKFCVLALKLN
ncbi:lamin tail domain-containing protein [Pedobacter insulae]|uniref:Lamin Tail Domain n=1 Tax=Pedobacter insulae TaxID=414048 RepID=A0A1I2TNJ7_9SPHI|nr:lamin tail domain-containing protein [Pedobacter insulae]SFG66502.1 Lamin Tail Domain [Pedobacter insulae]